MHRIAKSIPENNRKENEIFMSKFLGFFFAHGGVHMKHEKRKVVFLAVCVLLCGVIYSRAYWGGTLLLQESEIPLQNSSKNPSQNQMQQTKININTASKEELMLLDGIGEVMAERILAYRTEHGAFESIEQLQEIKGIGEKTYADLMAYVTIE